MPVAASRLARPRRGRPCLLLGLAVALTANPVLAARCGDDVDGRGTRVACACGDALVSSARLAPSDPLVQMPCSAAGLVVDVPSTVTRPVTLDLAGAIVAGSGRGIGIEVLAGGPHGIVVTGPGGVRGFDLGIVAREGAIASIVAVESSDNVRDGFRLAGRDYRLDACRADRNGRDGFVLHGQGYRLDGCEAVGNGRDGFAIRGRPAASVADANVADANGRRGARPRSRAQRDTEAR